MSTRVRQLFPAAVLVALLALAGCGSFFSNHHGCGTCVAPTFLFTTELNTISGFTLSTAGVPSLVGSLGGPNTSQGIVTDKLATLLFVSDFQNAAVDAFTINAGSGTLSMVAGSPFSAGPAPGGGGLAIDPTTQFLYITQVNSAAVAGFTIATGTGVLTPIQGSPFPAGNTPMQAIVDPSGKFLYVSNLNDANGSISAYTIDSTSGALSAVLGSPFPTQAGFPGPNHMAIGGGGKFLYVAMSGTVNANNSISAFSIDPNSGALTQLSSSPFTTGNDPLGIATDPAGKFLYTANSQDNTVSAFTIDGSSGNLTAVAGSPFGTNGIPNDLAVDPSGIFLFVGQSGSNGLAGFNIDATSGGLTPIPGSPFSTGGEVHGLTFARP